MVGDGFLVVVSQLFGWVYFLCWSASFYPQSILNYRRKTTAGTTVDFPLINCLGMHAPHLAPVLFPRLLCFQRGALLFARRPSAVRGTKPWPTPDRRLQRHNLCGARLPPVRHHDEPVLAQGLGFTPSPGNRPSRFILGIAFGCIVGVASVSLIVASAQPGDPQYAWCALDVVYAVSYVKLVVTLIKYTPQVVTNYRNKSTKGWSILQILLDFVGGLLSCSQQGIDSYLQRDWSGITGNPVKFALGNVSMIYDLIFMTQHYVLYRVPASKSAEGSALLQGDEEHQRLD
ncbi:cystinosin [Verticillium dahliae VdLs.17]|uniref:Cystinosin n=1 Tax=Verticillium dahliae (strain VdLs.17 / ATCC MYA-4575 / FGSC 10137) TaxID=498257 RepID=G2XDT9_VERDV|nr:cystinosin [Verticillium dahliae VdLs.17]EGY17987.1 cystinosin [Verticillium dahliae VdLs.17]KAH6698725.1 cystinosin [Verticillium dahliae]